MSVADTEQFQAGNRAKPCSAEHGRVDNRAIGESGSAIYLGAVFVEVYSFGSRMAFRIGASNLIRDIDTIGVWASGVASGSASCAPLNSNRRIRHRFHPMVQ